MQIAVEDELPQPLRAVCTPFVFPFFSFAHCPQSCNAARGAQSRVQRIAGTLQFIMYFVAESVCFPQSTHCFSARIWAEKRQEFVAFNRLKALNNPC